jgi:hypothetical protein
MHAHALLLQLHRSQPPLLLPLPQLHTAAAAAAQPLMIDLRCRCC